jgi:hypothetical protein
LSAFFGFVGADAFSAGVAFVEIGTGFVWAFEVDAFAVLVAFLVGLTRKVLRAKQLFARAVEALLPTSVFTFARASWPAWIGSWHAHLGFVSVILAGFATLRTLVI